MKKIHSLIILLLFYITGMAQDWTLKLKSTVELRTWKLTSRADKTEKSIQGATIILLSGSSVIKEIQSDADGNFEIEIPANGDYYLSISYPGCNSKKFYVSTKGVPNEHGSKDFKPSVKIGGFMMSKPIKGVDYLGLQDPLLKVEYKNTESGFDKDETVSNKGISIVSNIMDAENVIINKFCNNTKLGDDALTNKNYSLAKNYYTKALELIPGEEYPILKLKKAEDGIKEKKAIEDALAEDRAAQVEASKHANEKSIEEKKAKDKALFDKAAQDRIEKEKMKPKPEIKPAPPTTVKNTSPPATHHIKTGSKRKVANKIGANKYKEAVQKADDYYKKKRYQEAKEHYEEALKYKNEDPYVNGKLAEIEKLIKQKQPD